MKKTLFLLTIAFATLANAKMFHMPNIELDKLYNQYVVDNDNDTLVPKLYVTKITDRTFSMFEFPQSAEKMVKSVKIPKKYKKFNPKKDNIANYRLIKSTVNNVDQYQLFIVHSNGTACDMNEFSIQTVGLKMKQTQSDDGNLNYYQPDCTTFDIANSRQPNEGKIIVTHKETGMAVSIPYRLAWNSWINSRGNNMAVMVIPTQSNIGEPVRVVLEMNHGHMWLLRGKLGINVSGRDGKNGSNGSWGISGSDYRTWTDKNGNEHVQQATRGLPGENGENGGNGQKGGNLLVLRDPNVPEDDITILCNGGKGGKGGVGGHGGRHGKGCGLTGYAPDGKDGKDGEDGSRGSAITVQFPALTDYFNAMMSTYKFTTAFPYFVTDVSPKEHKDKNKGY